MGRWEFMRKLEELLFDISPSEREEALQYRMGTWLCVSDSDPLPDKE